MENHSSTSARAEYERYRRKSRRSGFLNTLLFYILPFILFNAAIFFLVTAVPKVEVTVSDTEDYLTTQAEIRVRSLLPVKTISADLDGDILELGEKKKGSYTVRITKNGLLAVELNSINGMSAQQFEQINILDDNPPSIENAFIENGIVTLTFTDSQSGISFDSVLAYDSDGSSVTPLEADRSTNTFSFRMDPAGLRVLGQDRAGNEVQGTFTSHKEGGKEQLTSSIESTSEESGT